ncbi:MAG: MATE family efflux transporter [Polyangiaceae bacterium]
MFGDRALTMVGLPAVGLPSLGATGAGIATSFSSLMLALIAVSAAWKARPENATIMPENKLDHAVTTRKLIRVGVPIGFQMLTEMGVFAVASLLMGRLGASVAAAHQIALGLSSFTFMAVIGMGAATAVRVGRAIGAGDQHSARRAGITGITLTGIYMSGCALVFLLIPRPLAALFTPQEAVIDIAVALLFVSAAFQIADGVQGAAAGALRGAGDSKFASWANIVCHWMIGLPIGCICCFYLGMGARGMWWGLSAGLFVVAAVSVIRFLKLSSRTINAL